MTTVPDASNVVTALGAGGGRCRCVLTKALQMVGAGSCHKPPDTSKGGRLVGASGVENRRHLFQWDCEADAGSLWI